MLVIYARNVASALPQGLKLLREVGVKEDSRAGQVLVAPCPVMTVYDYPQERVIFSPERDANPFFHLAEAMWMLAGRNDVEFLNLFIRDFGSRFGEPDGTVHGAYGYRWREHFGMDQLDSAVRLLKENPLSRQVLLTMWDPNIDLGTHYRDRPCNTQIYLRVQRQALDITVTCRSNDMLWGAYGSNAVHFSILQEYLAARIGINVGKYYQFSNNFHAYTEQLNKYAGDLCDIRPNLRPEKLVDHLPSFDEELGNLLWSDQRPKYNIFLSHTFYPMLQVYKGWRAKRDVTSWLDQILADDWRVAATEWIARRKKP